jgi:hypothetical protein
MIAGMVYDLTGGYTWFLIAGTIGSVLCGLLIMTLPCYPEFKPVGSARQAMA